MTTHNEENERIKRRYYSYLREARRQSDASVDAAAAAIDRFEVFLKLRPFTMFHRDRAVAFKRQLANQRARRTGQPLSKSTVDSTLRALVAFFTWLTDQPGYRSHFVSADAEHFNLSSADARAGRAPRPRPSPTLDQVNRVLAMMPHGTDVELRDRALVALALLTGARDGALRSLRLKHLRLADRKLDQDPREVDTKFSKAITTWFFPVGGEAETIVDGWAKYLERVLLWGPDDPLFPATRVAVGASRGFEPVGVERKAWTTAAPIRRIFHNAFVRAGLPYFHPHSFRHTLSRLGMEKCKTPEELKAWSQNLGHDEVLTTLTSYGQLTSERQAELIRAMSDPPRAELSGKTTEEALRIIEEAVARLRG